MQSDSPGPSRGFYPAGLILAVLFSGVFSPAAQQTRADEGFLVVMLLRTRIQIERIMAAIEAGGQELETNRQVIEAAEKKLQNAMETRNRQASIIPANDLRSARAAKKALSKAQSQRKEALARAERQAAELEEMLAPDRPRDRDRVMIAIATPYLKGAVVIRSDGTKAAFQEGRDGFLGSGDGVSSRETGRIEMQALDGRAVIQLHGGSEFKIEENGPKAQTLTFVQGTLSAVVERSEVLDRMIRERAQAPDDDLTPLLRRYQDLARADGAQPDEKALRIRIPDAVCSITGGEFGIEIKSAGMTEIVALGGTVDVSDLKGEIHVLVEEGFKVMVTKEGISAPQKITPGMPSPPGC